MITKNQIKLVRSLGDKKGRTEHGLFVAEGEKLITEIVRSGLEIEEIYRVNENCTWIEMNRLSSLKTPSRELAVVRIPRFDFAPSPLCVVLDGVQDPGNLGSIMRTADWFGINTIYCSLDTADCFAPKVVQSTMGAVTHINMIYCDLPSLLGSYSGRILGTFLENSTNIYSVAPPSEAILVLGNEGRGISAAVEALVTERVHIPRHGAGGGESLNVAAAAAIAVALLTKSL